MDPLSVTASIITLLAAGGSIVDGLEKLASLREAPDIILALNNEISDFRVVIFEIANYLQQEPIQSLPNAQGFHTNILPLLNRARDKLDELEALIEYKLVLPRNDGNIRLNKTGWIWERQKVKRIQEEIRSVKISLVATVGVLNSKSTLRLELQLATFQSASDNLHSQASQSLATIETSSSATENLLGQILRIVTQNQSRTEAQLHNVLAASTPQIAGLPGSERMTTSENDELGTTRGPPKLYHLRVSSTLQRRYLACTSSCTCRCHNRLAWTSPTWLSPLLGQIFAGYAGLPVLSAYCDQLDCQRGSEQFVSIQYFFPSWFALRILQAYLRFSRYNGIEQSLRVSRVVWNGAEIFSKIYSRDTKGVQALLGSREAFPFDVESVLGTTALDAAIIAGTANICRILLQQGADPYHESMGGRSTVRLVWMKILGKEYDARTSESMQTIMPACEIDDFGFSPLHQAILRLKSSTVDEVLQQNPRWTVDEEDTAGRTPISWAAQRGDYDAMVLLLHNRADPHKLDAMQRSSLFWAVRGGSLRCVRFLLDYGVDINRQDSYGQNVLTYLAYNSKGNYAHHTNMLSLLLQYQVNINCRALDGDSPLLMALENQKPALATSLIHHGADIHMKENSGYNALSVAVLFNYHSVLRLLLERQADHHGNIKQHSSFLHLVAKAADRETLKILTNPGSGLATRDVQVKRSDGLTPLEVARLRNNTTLEWQNAFMSFLWSVDATKVRVSPSERGAPGGGGARGDDSDGEEDIFMDALE